MTQNIDPVARYSGHEKGDSVYQHASGETRLSALGWAAALTCAFSVIELLGGYWANSLALIGDAGHMITDSASLLFALIAGFVSRRGVDSDHSFGHGRIEALAAFVNALAMLGVVGWIFWEASRRLSDPPMVAGGSVALVAGVGLLINIAVAWSLSRERRNISARAALTHVMGDLLGSLAALGAGALVYFGGPRFAIADPLLSFLVGLLVLRATFGVFRDTLRVLTDAVPEGVDYAEVGAALAALPGVRQVHDLHVWTMAPNHSAMMAHLLLEPGHDWGLALREARATLRRRFAIDHITLQPENAGAARDCRWCRGGGRRFSGR